MAYKKYAKKAVKKYPGFRKRWNVYMPAIKQLGNDVMYMKGLINSEPQAFVVQRQQFFSYNGFVESLCNIPTGDQYGNRTGNRILPRYISINLHIRKTTAGSAHNTIRFMILRSWIDNANAVGSLVASEVLQTTGSLFAPVSHLNDDITGPRGDRNRRIEVLRSKQITFDAINYNAYNKQFNIELNGGQKKEHIEFVDSSTNQPNSGGIYLLFISDVINTTDVQYTFESKLTYYDNQFHGQKGTFNNLNALKYLNIYRFSL